MIRLENWNMVCDKNPYSPPEIVSGRLVGLVYNHPNFNDGDKIITSLILKIDVRQNFAKTQCGNYVLGKPNPDWVKWLKENNFIETLENLNKRNRVLN